MSYFLIIDGLLYSCGNNYYGQLGLNDRNYREELTQVQYPNCKFASVSNHFSHTMAIDENGYLWSCGNNDFGQLGLNDYDNRWELTQVSKTKTFQAVSCGCDHTAAIDSEGFLWVCGSNTSGQLGLGEKKETNKLTKVSDNKFITVSCSENHTIVIDENRFLWCCGNNNYGQLGADNSNREVKILTKVCQQQFMTASTSLDHTVAIDINGHLWSCGKNTYGQLCFNRQLTNTTILSKVPNLEQKYLAVYCYYQSTLLIDDDNRLWRCGCNNNKKLDFDPDANGVSLSKNDGFTEPVFYINLTWDHAFVTTKDGTLWVSGHDQTVKFNNSEQQLDIFSKIPLFQPVDILVNCSPRKIGSRIKGAHY